MKSSTMEFWLRVRANKNAKIKQCAESWWCSKWTDRATNILSKWNKIYSNCYFRKHQNKISSILGLQLISKSILNAHFYWDFDCSTKNYQSQWMHPLKHRALRIFAAAVCETDYVSFYIDFGFNSICCLFASSVEVILPSSNFLRINFSCYTFFRLLCSNFILFHFCAASHCLKSICRDTLH